MENILHHQKDGWNPIDNGILPTYQLVQDFATIHSSRLFTTTTQNSSEFLVSNTLKTSKNHPRIGTPKLGSLMASQREW